MLKDIAGVATIALNIEFRRTGPFDLDLMLSLGDKDDILVSVPVEPYRFWSNAHDRAVVRGRTAVANIECRGIFAVG